MIDYFDAEMQDALMADAAKLRAMGVDCPDPLFIIDTDRTCVDCEEPIREGQEWFTQRHGDVCWDCWDTRYRRRAR